MPKKIVSKPKVVKPVQTIVNSRISFETRQRFFMLSESDRKLCIENIRKEEDDDLADQLTTLRRPVGKPKESISYDVFWEQDIKPNLVDKMAWWDDDFS